MAKRNFYKKSGDSKRVLKKTIRPTHKKISKNEEESEIVEIKKEKDEVSTPRIKSEDSDLRSLLMSPPDLDTIRHKPKEKLELTDTSISAPVEQDDDTDEKGSSLDNLVDNEIEVKTPDTMDTTTHSQKEESTDKIEPRNFSKPSQNSEETKQTQSEIDEIQRIIQQASSRLQDLEKQKREEEERRAKEAENVVVEKFDGVSDSSEEIALIKEELAHYQKENKRLQHELSLIKEDFTKEKELLEKTVKELKKKSHSKNPVEDNTFFSFSDQLKDALEMIDTLNDPNFKPHQSEVVIPQSGTANLQAESKVEPKKLNLTMPKVIKVDETPVTENPEEKKVEPQKEEKKVEKKKEEESSPKDKKKKKLLITGGTVAALLLTGSLVAFQSTRQPEVDQTLVEEYLSQNESQVLGVQTRKAAVPDGIVADKNSDAALSETEWAEYRDPSFALKLDYPANVTERLHTSNAITFLRKDSYIFKVTKITYEGTLDEYWQSVKDRGFKYESTPGEFKNRDMLHLQLLENVEYPGEKYLVKTDTAIYDIWFASDPTIYGEDDIARAKKMLESIAFL